MLSRVARTAVAALALGALVAGWLLWRHPLLRCAAREAARQETSGRWHL